MPPRRVQFTQESIDQQLQQIHLLDPSSSSENLEQLGPLIKQIHTSRQQEAFLRTVQGLIESKDAEIERICGENYQDFISSVSTLFTVKAYTDKMKDNISSLDSSVSQLGKGLVEKKRTLLQTRKTAANLDEAIDTIQACLRVLDVVQRVSEMIKMGKYWSALRSLDEIQSQPPSSLSQTPLHQHLMSALPSLRSQIKDAVTASTKQWLLEIRNNSGEIGRIALEGMEARTRRWRARREKDALLRTSRVGSAVELITYEKTEFNVLDNEKLKIDFKPLFECIHIYTMLDSLEDLQSSYQADRKAQSDLILPIPIPLPSLPAITQEISGFFIVETHVLETTGTFRSERDVEDLWDTVISRLTEALDSALRQEKDHEAYLKAKESLITFMTTLESPLYSTSSLHAFILRLFEEYVRLLEGQFSHRFEDIIRQDDHLPMQAETSQDIQGIMDFVWLSEAERQEIESNALPQSLPWSQTFYLCCQDLRGFITKFYAFVEGVSQHHRDIDELLSKSLDGLLIDHISKIIGQRLAGTSTLSQIAQIVTNLEHFQVACKELQRSLTNIRSAQRGGTIVLKAPLSFGETLNQALGRLTTVINSKLDDFFELAEYDWTPRSREQSPSMYLYELINWLTTVVDSLLVKDVYKEEAYKGAVVYIADCLMDFLVGPNVPMMNENAISNILMDVAFLEDELTKIGRAQLTTAFAELKLITSIPLNDAVSEYLAPASRQSSYASIKSKKLQSLLEKLARFGGSQRDAASRELGEKRRKQADAVGRIYPGEGR